MPRTYRMLWLSSRKLYALLGSCASHNNHGNQPRDQLAKAKANLGKVGRALGALRPAYVLLLRVVLTFVVSAVDCIYEGMPPHLQRLCKVQRAVNRVLTRALRVPQCPSWILPCPLITPKPPWETAWESVGCFLPARPLLNGKPPGGWSGAKKKFVHLKSASKFGPLQ